MKLTLDITDEERELLLEAVIRLRDTKGEALAELKKMLHPAASSKFDGKDFGIPQLSKLIHLVSADRETFSCTGCGWEGPMFEANPKEDEPPTCPICG